MSLAYVGRTVLTPANPLTNGGADKMPAMITDVLGEQGAGPNGGTMVSLKVFTNISLTLLSYDASSEFVEYEDIARTLGIGAGCWPTESNE